MIHEKSNFPKPGDMRKEVYDANNNGIVDNAERVNGHSVESDVPEDAVFTDTTYAEASSEAAGLMSAGDKAKLDGLVFDEEITENSGNLVSSGMVFTALAGKQNALTIDSTPTENSLNPVSSGGVFAALSQNRVTVISADSTDEQYPTAKAVWDLFQSLGTAQNTNETGY